ncbi:MAG: hypothetical protein LUC23_01815, partial [Prevotellaceae bacterium]|nr:hypothetical protein [Prevotellaceae bacterium]
DTNPTEAQKEAGNYKKGHVRVAGFDLSIENPAGSVRRGTDENGRKWASKMNNTYGYIKGIVGVDGDHVDVFLSNDMDAWDNENAFVVDQYNPDGTFDEHKVMLGFNDSKDALAAYLSNYEKGWADGRRIDISSVSMNDFRDWVNTSKRKLKAFAEYKGVDSKVTRMSVAERADRASSRLAEREVMAEQVGSLAGRLNLRNVEVLTSTDRLPEELMNHKGFYDRKTGKITVVVPNHEDVADVEKTLLHEAVGHYGLRQMFGSDFDSFLDKVYRNATRQTREEIARMAARYGWDFPRATEEYLASLAEDVDFKKAGSAWNRIKGFFREMLRRMGFTGEGMSDNELRYVLWKSYDNLRADRGSVFAMAADIAQQSRLEVGGYNTKNRILARQGSTVEYARRIVRDRYEERMKKNFYQTREALQDSMASLEVAMMEMLGDKKKSIEDIDGHENAYLGENRLSSVNKAEADAFAHLLFKPMLEEVAKLARNKAEREELTDYMMAKHGLERNVVMAERDAKAEYEKYRENSPGGKKTLQDFIAEKRQRDYAGLTALMGYKDSEVADAERAAQDVVDAYEQAHDTKGLWERVNAVNKAILSKHYESGMMDKETYDRVSSMFNYYIPLRGFDETTSREAYAYLDSKGTAFTAPVRRAEGRKSKADDPFANMMGMSESAIAQGNRNALVKQRFLNFVLNHPSDLISLGEVWVKYDEAADEWRLQTPEIEPTDTPAEVERKTKEFEEKMRALQEAEPEKYRHGEDAMDVPFRVVSERDLKEHQVVVKQAGRTYILTVNGNPRLAQALNGKTNPDNDVNGAIGALVRVAERVNRRLSSVYTTRNPDFIVTNFLRDMVYANSIVWVKENPNYALRFHRNVLRCNPVNMERLLVKHRGGTLDMNNDMERQFHDFIMNGGETGYTVVRDTDKRKSDIARELKKAGAATLPGEMLKAYTLIGERMDELNRAIELSGRFAAFITSREMGRSMDRSIYDAKEITVNFNKKGAGSKFMGTEGQTKPGNAAAFTSGLGRTAYVFWNASVQGITNLGKQFAGHPAKALTLAGTFFTWGFVQAMLGALGGGDGDDDDKEEDADKSAYFNMPEYTRRSNIMVRAGKSWVSIPISQELHAFHGIGELLGSIAFGKERLTGGEIAEAVAEQLSQPLPVDFLEGGHLSWKSWMPTTIKPVFEAGTNEGWTGMPIYKKSDFNK